MSGDPRPIVNNADPTAVPGQNLLLGPPLLLPIQAAQQIIAVNGTPAAAGPPPPPPNVTRPVPGLPPRQEKKLLECCKDPTDNFITAGNYDGDTNITYNYDMVARELERIFVQNRPVENAVFKEWKDKLTPYFFSCLRENTFATIKHCIEYPAVAIARGRLTPDSKKTICRAYYEYREIEKNASKERIEKDKKETKERFDTLIGELDNLQKGERSPTPEEVRSMRTKLFDVHNDRTPTNNNTIYAMNYCMTSGSNRSQVLRLEELLTKNGDEFREAITSNADKRIIVRAYKIFMREQANVVGAPTRADVDAINLILHPRQPNSGGAAPTGFFQYPPSSSSRTTTTTTTTNFVSPNLTTPTSYTTSTPTYFDDSSDDNSDVEVDRREENDDSSRTQRRQVEVPHSSSSHPSSHRTGNGRRRTRERQTVQLTNSSSPRTATRNQRGNARRGRAVQQTTGNTRIPTGGKQLLDQQS